MSDQLKNFVEACSEAASLEEVESAGRDFLRLIGGADTSFTLGQILGAGGVVQPGPILGDFEHPWLTYYIENDCLSYDPVPVLAMTVQEDLMWHDVKNASGLIKRQRNLFHAASEFGLTSGAAFPIPQLDGSVFILIVASGRELALTAVERFLIRSVASERYGPQGAAPCPARDRGDAANPERHDEQGDRARNWC